MKNRVLLDDLWLPAWMFHIKWRVGHIPAKCRKLPPKAIEPTEQPSGAAAEGK